VIQQPRTSPLVTVITVAKNAAHEIERTLKSVKEQSYSCVEYIVIDAVSRDSTLEIVNSYSDVVTLFISEPDHGIYDAMNKAIKFASGPWLHFLNAGDTYASPDSLSRAISHADHATSIIFSDTIIVGARKEYLSKASFNPIRVVHQSVIYRKSLHDIHGYYLVSPGITISDYIFFCSISGNSSVKCSEPISRFYTGGVSSSIMSFYQKLSFDFMTARISRPKFMATLALYPVYRSLKRYIYG
jgi:glycosyltransferase involved in cell wall biosynthesis